MSLIVDDSVRRALEEDLGAAGDITTDATVPSDVRGSARIVARAAGTVAGLQLAQTTFRLVDSDLTWTQREEDGKAVAAGAELAHLAGRARSILTGERTALNFLGHLSGVATATADLVRRVAGTGTGIVDTRKTTPGLRAAEKYAVRMGGGVNHRFGLHDAVLVKDNHIVAAGGIRAAVERVRARVGHLVAVEVEVDTLEQLEELMAVGANAVLLDNMDVGTLTSAVSLVGGKMTTEASGGITADTVREVAETGVDYVSVGWITHSAPSLDVSLEMLPGG